MTRLRVRSLVGLIPLLAVDIIEPELLEELPGFARRLDWFLANRPELCRPGLTLARAGIRRPPTAGPGARGPDAPPAGADARPRRVPQPVRHPLAEPAPRGRTRSTWPSAVSATRSATSRRSRAPVCSGATPTGGGRSGSPSTTCSSRRSGPSTATTGTTSWSSTRRARVSSCRSTRSRTTWPRASWPSSAGAPDGRRPLFGDDERVPDPCRLARRPAVPRVLPRRHRCGPGGEPPDRLDRPGRATHRALTRCRVGAISRR